MILRVYKEGEVEEIYNRFYKGGALWFIERTDTNQFAYIHSPSDCGLSSSPNFGISKTYWSDTINVQNMSAAFLTKKDAKKEDLNFMKDGCHYCGHGSKEIPITITEHEFQPPPTREKPAVKK